VTARRIGDEIEGMCTLTGFLLWAERLQIDAFFSEDTAFRKRIPIPVFEMLCYLVETHDFGTGGLGLKNL